MATSFTDTFDHFFAFAEKVLKYDLSGELKLTSTNVNAIQSALNGYKQIYNKTRISQKHIDKFSEIYKKCRPTLIKDDLDTFMFWFKESSFTIIPKEHSRNKIFLTIIFRNCIRIAEHISEQAETPGNEHLLNDTAAMYPEYFMLHLFRLFCFCTDDADKSAILTPYIVQLESVLGLRKDEVPEIADIGTEILSAAAEMAQDMGFNVPKGRPDINANQFKEMLRSITQNPDAKEAIKGVFSGVDMSDPKDLPNAIGKLLSKMTETASERPEGVKKALAATASN